MVVILPRCPVAPDAQVSLLSNRVVQTSPLGGPTRRLERPGSRHSLSLSFPPFRKEKTLEWIGKLAAAAGSGEPVRIAFPQPRPSALNSIPGALVAGGSQSGRALNVDGILPDTLAGKKNYVAYSEMFNNASWAKFGQGTASAAIVTANQAVAPDGTITADQVDFNRGAGTTSADLSGVLQTITDLTVGQPYTVSIWHKGASVLLNSVGGVDLVVPPSSEWQRVQISGVAVATSKSWLLGIRGNSSPALATAFLWGAQFNPGLTADDYVPTAAIAAYATISAGRALSLIVGSRSYLYLIADDAIVSQSGAATFALDCLLRASPADNTAINFDAPIIEGFLDEESYAVLNHRLVTAPISITEAH